MEWEGVRLEGSCQTNKGPNTGPCSMHVAVRQPKSSPGMGSVLVHISAAIQLKWTGREEVLPLFGRKERNRREIGRERTIKVC